jgi:hypothetical protein
MKSFKSCKSFKSTPVVPATSTELAEAQEEVDNYLEDKSFITTNPNLVNPTEEELLL